MLGGVVVATAESVGASRSDSCWRNTGRQIVDGKPVLASTNFGRITSTWRVATCESDSGVLLKGITAPAIARVFEPGDAVIVIGVGAESLAVLYRHVF